MMGYLSIQRLRFVSSCLILDRLILFASFATFATFVRLFVCSLVRLFVCLFAAIAIAVDEIVTTKDRTPG